MKKIIVIMKVALLCGCLRGQNLVPNHSFEEAEPSEVPHCSSYGSSNTAINLFNNGIQD